MTTQTPLPLQICGRQGKSNPLRVSLIQIARFQLAEIYLENLRVECLFARELTHTYVWPSVTVVNEEGDEA